MQRKKALLAIIFAGGMLNLQLPVLSDNRHESTDSVIDAIVRDTNVSEQDRAFYLLILAYGYLHDDDTSATEASHRPRANGLTAIINSGRWEYLLTDWSQTASKLACSHNSGTAKQKESAVQEPSIKSKNVELANEATEKAVAQIDKEPDGFAKLNLYYIASQCFKATGNTKGQRLCIKVLEDAFQACEKSSTVDEKAIVTASSIINIMAYRLIPIEVPVLSPQDNPLAGQTKVPAFTDDDFRGSEELRLRAVAMADRLPPNNQVRRKAHRDLALWYAELGKTEMAEKEKQILFGLVGKHDDRILYPKAVGCGSLVWWKTDEKLTVMGCGMG